jgi:hypothetical protein
MTEKRTFVAGFDADVFISYARLDDKPIVGDEDGWVSQLYNELVGHLPEYLGGDAIVWRDREGSCSRPSISSTYPTRA